MNQMFFVSANEIFRTELLEFISNLIYLFSFTIFVYFLPTENLQQKKELKWEVGVLKILVSIYFIYLLLPVEIIAVYFWLFDSVFYYAGIIATSLLLVLSIRDKNRLFLILSIFCLGLFFVKQIITGARGGIVIVSLIVLIYGIILLDRSKIKRLILITILPIALLLILQNII
jgi:membrane-bound ClpP family serine protease